MKSRQILQVGGNGAESFCGVGTVNCNIPNVIHEIDTAGKQREQNGRREGRPEKQDIQSLLLIAQSKNDWRQYDGIFSPLFGAHGRQQRDALEER